MSKKNFLYLFLFIISFLITKSVLAVCPVCTIAVGTCVGVSRWLGVDDTISGLWVGGLIVSVIIWTINWFNKKNVHFIGRKIIIVVAYYAMAIGSLCWKGILGHPLNKILGLDKLLFGMILGSVFFLAGVLGHNQLKKKNNEKVFFPFQKVIIPIFPLIILSIIFYCLLK